MEVHFEECESLSDCDNLQKNEFFINALIDTFRDSFQIEKPQMIRGRDSSVITEEEFTSVQPNRIESLNIWHVKRPLFVEKFHLVLCYASNEKGESFSTEIIMPSDLSKGIFFLFKIFSSYLTKNSFYEKFLLIWSG